MSKKAVNANVADCKWLSIPNDTEQIGDLFLIPIFVRKSYDNINNCVVNSIEYAIVEKSVLEDIYVSIYPETLSYDEALELVQNINKDSLI